MDLFLVYLQLGWDHILDPQGIDHMLFIIALCAIYKLSDWKKVLVLVTAFTLGHSLTLALSALELVAVDQDLVEQLIPITILATALSNLFYKSKTNKSIVQYLLALFFGLIHGLGFSNYFRALLSKSQEVVFPLFSFNIGLELGQLLIVLVLGLVLYVSNRFYRVNPRDWNLFVSGAAAGVSLYMMLG